MAVDDVSLSWLKGGGGEEQMRSLARARRSRLDATPHWFWSAAIVMSVVAVDWVTTELALAYLRGSVPHRYFGGLIAFHIVDNTGAAFGFGARYEWIVEVAAVFSLFVLAMLAHKATKSLRIGLAMAVGGGLGNLIVRLTGSDGPLHSPVVDWIHLSFYPPTFNLADLALRLGTVVAIVGLVPTRRTRDHSGAMSIDANPRGPVDDGLANARHNRR